jgi:hypothetical protein
VASTARPVDLGWLGLATRTVAPTLIAVVILHFTDDDDKEKRKKM